MAKLKETMFAWNKGGDCHAGRWPDNGGWSDPWEKTGGACYAHVKKMSHEQMKTHLFIEAMHMIIRDKVDPAKVYAMMLQIDEFRDGLSDDMPGVAMMRLTDLRENGHG